MRISEKHRNLARRQLAAPSTPPPLIEDLTEFAVLLPETERELVRSKLTKDQISQLALELKLDLRRNDSWHTLWQMAQWL